MDTAKEKNLKKLARTSIPMNFVKKCNGSWDHQDWLDFCTSIEEKGYAPIDFDALGALLESKKVVYNEKSL